MSSILDDNYREFNFEDSRESKSNQSDNNSVKLSSSKLRKNDCGYLSLLLLILKRLTNI